MGHIEDVEEILGLYYLNIDHRDLGVPSANYDTCNYHGSRKAVVGATQNRTKEDFDLSNHGNGKTDEELQESFLEKHVNTEGKSGIY